jgi:hypothetical protein
MTKEKISVAKRRSDRRKKQGKKTGQFDFEFDINVESLEDYYNISLSDREIDKFIGEYDSLNDDVYREFNQRTQLSGTDVTFLFLAIGLQCVRQYILTDFKERLSDDEAANQTKGHHEEHSNRRHRYYNPSLEEIISNPVPFDANIGSNGALKGGGKLGHRATAIGHDPIIGLIFGTANIATSTLTNSSFASFHISTKNKRDYFKNKAKTLKVLEVTNNKLINEGLEGKKIIATSLIKEIIHLQSDIYSKNSLPLPIISSFDPKLASQLAINGFDMANFVTVGKQATYAILINSIIEMLHQLLYNPQIHGLEKLYRVRTKKILMYSNVIASFSNVLYVAFTEDIKKLDIGGLLVTIHRVVSDEKFIRKVMNEFIDSKVSKIYEEKLEKVNDEYDELLNSLAY